MSNVLNPASCGGRRGASFVTYDGKQYRCSATFDSDEQIDNFLEAMYENGFAVIADRDIVNKKLTLFYTVVG